jgi:deoxycytidylate deaminase
MHKFLKLAYEHAKAHPYDPSLEYNLCAVIVRGGKVLSIGYNRRGWNGLSEFYKAQDHACTIHAEIDAIVSKRKKIRFEGAKVYVARVRADGTVGNAKPCEMCQHVLFNYGVKKAYFTIGEFPFIDSMRVVNPATL